MTEEHVHGKDCGCDPEWVEYDSAMILAEKERVDRMASQLLRKHQCLDCDTIFYVPKDTPMHQTGLPEDGTGLSCPRCDGWAPEAKG